MSLMRVLQVFLKELDVGLPKELNVGLLWYDQNLNYNL